VTKLDTVTVTSITNKSKSIPRITHLSQNYPNPFNPRTIINYELPISSEVQLEVYNLLGQKVALLVSEKQPPGSYEVEFNGESLASGIYYYILKTNSWQDIKKMILLK
jgi:hypothetical protein